MIETLESDYHFFSFTGSITYAKKGKTIQAIKKLPLEKCLVETDCPYLVPIQKKGEENQPAFVPYMAEKIAEIKQQSIKDVTAILYDTSQRFFGIS